MDKQNDRLCGVVEAVTFQNEDNGFAVLTLVDEDGDLVCAVGPLAGSAPGERLSMSGRYIQHASYGRQFEAQACTHSMPESEESILKYLSSGVLPGIGPVLAKRIVQKFGEMSLEILASQPEKMAEVQGVTLAKARQLGQRFAELFGAREAVAALAGLGLDATEALTVYRQYGKGSQKQISNNPYILCGYPLYLPFARADEIADRLALDKHGSERVRAAALYTLRHNLKSGHTCLPKPKLLQTAAAFFCLEQKALDKQLTSLCEDGETYITIYGDEEYVYLADSYRAEISAALHLKKLLNMPSEHQKGIKKQLTLRETAEGIKYAPQQKQAIEQALCKHVLVITGGPGTGKTTTVNAIIALLEQQAERVLLAAPTGRAAKRMTELTGRKASTIHRLLECGYMPGSDLPRFGRNAENPLKCDVIVIDEMSMVDTMLFESLLAALPHNCRIIMVGDTDQLPSVGPGNVLRGAIDSGEIPVVSLTEIFRQAAESLIVSNAHRIVEGDMPKKGGKEDDFFFIRAFGEACRNLVCELVSQRLPKSYGFSAIADIQVLCPGRKGLLGAEALNAQLQEILNPHEPDKPEMRGQGMVFRLGDKVMQVRNNYDISYTRMDGEPGAGAYNGDIGFIEAIDMSTGSLTVMCEDRHVYYTSDNLHELELAYAITIHKSQGSEFEAVVLPVAETPQQLRYRNLLYTGVTRAKKLCVVVGEDEVLKQMVNNDRKTVRYSCFSEMLKDENVL